MKKIVLFILVLNILIFSEMFAQKKDTSDYFLVGLYTGSYFGNFPLYPENDIINSIAIECEYFKFCNLSFYFQGLYQFTDSDINKLFKPKYGAPYTYTTIQKPETYRLNFSFGGRYYLRKMIVNPFFQFGVNHEINYISEYYYQIDLFEYIIHSYGIDNYFYRLSTNLGVGLNFKLNQKFSMEVKYDIYKTIFQSNDDFVGYSLLGGIKYTL